MKFLPIIALYSVFLGTISALADSDPRFEQCVQNLALKSIREMPKSFYWGPDLNGRCPNGPAVTDKVPALIADWRKYQRTHSKSDSMCPWPYATVIFRDYPCGPYISDAKNARGCDTSFMGDDNKIVQTDIYSIPDREYFEFIIYDLKISGKAYDICIPREKP